MEKYFTEKEQHRGWKARTWEGQTLDVGGAWRVEREDKRQMGEKREQRKVRKGASEVMRILIDYAKAFGLDMKVISSH